MNQTYRDFELLLCDDCSPDDTYAVLQEYAARDSRIVLMKNEQNLGGLSTRNRLFRKARGTYSMWMDNDDWLELDFLEKAASFLKEMPTCDILEFPYEFILENGQHQVFQRPNLIHGEDSLASFFLSMQRPHTWLMWSKVIRTEIVQKFLPPDGRRILDDVFFGLPFFTYAKLYRWVALEKAMYHHKHYGGAWSSYESHPTLERLRKICELRRDEIIYNATFGKKMGFSANDLSQIVTIADVHTIFWVISRLPVEQHLVALKIFFEYYCQGDQIVNGFPLPLNNKNLLEYLRKILPHIPEKYINSRLAEFAKPEDCPALAPDRGNLSLNASCANRNICITI